MAGIDSSKISPSNPFEKSGTTAEILQAAIADLDPAQAARWRVAAGGSLSVATMAELQSGEELSAAALAEGAGYLELVSLGMHLLEVSKDLPAAIDIFEKVASHPLAPSFYRRKLAFIMLKDPKQTVRAYRMLKDVALKDPASLRREDNTEIARLEAQLGIPEAKRIKP